MILQRKVSNTLPILLGRSVLNVVRDGIIINTSITENAISPGLWVRGGGNSQKHRNATPYIYLTDLGGFTGTATHTTWLKLENCAYMRNNFYAAACLSSWQGSFTETATSGNYSWHLQANFLPPHIQYIVRGIGIFGPGWAINRSLSPQSFSQLSTPITLEVTDNLNVHYYISVTIPSIP